MSSKETFMEEFKIMFAQYMQNEEKSRSKHHEVYSHGRKIYNPHKERKGCVLSLEVCIILQSLKYAFPTLMETKMLKNI